MSLKTGQNHNKTITTIMRFMLKTDLQSSFSIVYKLFAKKQPIK